MAVIELTNICLRRGGHDILQDISWRIEHGRHWALLGRNGAGKTTLLKVITGYEWPTRGSVTLLGRRFGACDIRQVRKAVGWVSCVLQQRLPAGDSAMQIVASGLEASMGLYRSYSREEMEQARQVLVTLGCGDVAEAPYGILSQGEQQRVLIARALVHEPAVLILDEPCVGLDPAARHRFLEDLGRLAERADAPTMILVTHHIEEIGPWISHGLVLKDGRCLAQGRKEEILTAAVLGRAFELACRVVRDEQSFHLHLRQAGPGQGDGKDTAG